MLSSLNRGLKSASSPVLESHSTAGLNLGQRGKEAWTEAHFHSAPLLAARLMVFPVIMELLVFKATVELGRGPEGWPW